ncbi:MAG: hypothetical protein WC707_00175 [Candidatus Babeliaceae bacterium]|jgi:hypothetical protein
MNKKLLLLATAIFANSMHAQIIDNDNLLHTLQEKMHIKMQENFKDTATCTCCEHFLQHIATDKSDSSVIARKKFYALSEQQQEAVVKQMALQVSLKCRFTLFRKNMAEGDMRSIITDLNLFIMLALERAPENNSAQKSVIILLS